MRLCSLFLPLAALALGGCVSLRCPENGGQAWRELRSEHFVVKTDLPEDEAQATVRQLERLRMAEARVLGLPDDPPGRLRAVIFSDWKALQSFGAKTLWGYVGAGTAPTAVMVSWPLSWRLERPFEVLAHELAHYLLVIRLNRPPPRWLTEGMAVFLETLDVDAYSNAALVGSQPDGAALLRWHGPPLSLEELWAWNGFSEDQELTNRRYASSWAWVRVLQRHDRERFERFLGRLSAGEPERDAFGAEYPEALRTTLAGVVSRFVADAIGQSAQESLSVPRYEGPLSERLLAAAEVHEVFATVWKTVPVPKAPAERAAHVLVELDKALRHDPRHRGARLTEVALRRTRAERLAGARELAALYPLEATAWIAVAENAADPERLEALERAEALAGADASALNTIAWEHVLDGRGPAALPLATESLRLSPWDRNVLDTYAAALALSGRCREAIAQQQRALGLLGENEAKETREGFRRRLEIYQRGCQEPPAKREARD